MAYQCQGCEKIYKSRPIICKSCQGLDFIQYDGDEKSVLKAKAADKKNQPHRQEHTMMPITKVDTNIKNARVSTGLSELDKVLGGDGFTASQIALLGGEPGLGKSTLFLQAAYNIAKNVGNVVYLTGEESVIQIRERADRIGAVHPKLYLHTNTNVLSFFENDIPSVNPVAIFIDSINMLYHPDVNSEPNSPRQIVASIAVIQNYAKSQNVPIFLIGQVVKTGAIAGPKKLEHMVDTVLLLTGGGQSGSEFRFIRPIKNRHGSVDTFGFFNMTSEGMVSVSNPSERLLANRAKNKSGTAIAAVVNGNRAFLMEAQALVTNGSFFLQSDNYSYKSLAKLVQVISKFLLPSISDYNIIVSLVLDENSIVKDTTLELAMAMSIASSALELVVPDDTVFIGALDLTSTLRGAQWVELKVKEAVSMGYKRIYVPKMGKELKIDNAKVIQCENLFEVFTKVFPESKTLLDRPRKQKGKMRFDKSKMSEPVDDDTDFEDDLEDFEDGEDE